MDKPHISEDHVPAGEVPGSTTYAAGMRIYWHDGPVCEKLTGVLPETVIRAVIGRMEHEKECDAADIKERTEAVIQALEGVLEKLEFLAQRREYYLKWRDDEDS